MIGILVVARDVLMFPSRTLDAVVTAPFFCRVRATGAGLAGRVHAPAARCDLVAGARAREQRRALRVGHRRWGVGLPFVTLCGISGAGC